MPRKATHTHTHQRGTQVDAVHQQLHGGLAKWSKKTRVFLTNFTCSNLGPSSTPEGGKGNRNRLQWLFLIYPESKRLLDTPAAWV